MSVELLYVGITHASAPLAVRESLRPGVEKQRAMLQRLDGLASGRMVVSTCERFELYARTATIDPRSWIGSLADWFHVPVRVLAPHVTVLSGVSAAEHLLRVAAGLESRILGEPQILGQVREAYLRALESASLDSVLCALGRSAIRAGRRVRHETPINRERVSIATVVADWLEQERGARGGRRSVVVGTGRLAMDVAGELGGRRTGEVTVVGRNRERAELLARMCGCGVAGLAALPEVFASADGVIVCTSSPTYLIDGAALTPRRMAPLCIADLSVPRNVDPAVARIPFVRLAHLDDLVTGRSGERGDLASAVRIVEEELAAFDRWQRERAAVPRIRRLIESAGSRVAREELHRRIVQVKAEAAA